MDKNYSQLVVYGREGQQARLDVELKARGENQVDVQRLVEVVVKDSASNDTILNCKASQATTFKALQEALTPLAADLGYQGTPAWKVCDETNGDFFWVHKTCHHCRIDEFDSVMVPTCLTLVVNKPASKLDRRNSISSLPLPFPSEIAAPATTASAT